MKKYFILILILYLVNSLTGCSNFKENNTSSIERENIYVAIAASMKNCFDNEIIPEFEKEHTNIKVIPTYDSSGKLKIQIEEGMNTDVFISASMEYMNTLKEKNLIDKNSIINILQNKIVLILPKESDYNINSFEEILKVDTIALGDPRSVPAGQYAKEVFEHYNIWEDVLKKTSLGNNVIEVLNWVSENSADAGVVYATDAASNKNVRIILEAPEDSVSKIIYPIGIIKSSEKKDTAQIFINFLRDKNIVHIFERYGFTYIPHN
ncbi:MAG: molybdate ABC transporter substrate-binding protein [Tissierellales bacterium]|nr:molybdate ABC transporter substrate-binding protein [Tissierellales bacterium]